MKKRNCSISNIGDQLDKCSSVTHRRDIESKLQETKISREKIKRKFVSYRDEVDSIWLTNHSSVTEERSCRSWGSV